MVLVFVFVMRDIQENSAMFVKKVIMVQNVSHVQNVVEEVNA